MGTDALNKAIQATTDAAITMLRKSQMAFDFSAPVPTHHIAYLRTNDHGTISRIAAKGTGNHSAPASSHGQEVPTMRTTGARAAEPKTHRQMTARLKADGIWISSIQSFGIRHKHSKWFIFWNDQGDGEHVETDGTDGGSTKAWQERMAKEKATEQRYKQQYPEPAPTPAPFHGTPTIEKMAALITAGNFDYNEFETTPDTECDSCKAVTDVRTAHDSDNAGNTMHGQVCDNCLDAAHQKVIDDGSH